VALAQTGAARMQSEEAKEYARGRIKSRQNPGPPFDVERDRGRWVRVIDRRTAEGGTVSIRIDVTDLMRREAILSVVNAAASQILKSGDWRAPVEGMLAQLGRAMGVSRVYLGQNEVSPEGRYLQTDLFEWDAPGIPRIIDDATLS